MLAGCAAPGELQPPGCAARGSCGGAGAASAEPAGSCSPTAAPPGARRPSAGPRAALQSTCLVLPWEAAVAPLPSGWEPCWQPDGTPVEGSRGEIGR